MAERVDVVVDGALVGLDASPATSLLRALRDAGVLGPKGACEQGECGSCSVVLDGALVCACLVPAAVCDGSEVSTVASLVRPDLAEALACHGAVQCGFCTPGFVVTIESLLACAPEDLTLDGVREELAGNLCRCTGYEGLFRAVLDVHERRRRRRR